MSVLARARIDRDAVRRSRNVLVRPFDIGYSIVHFYRTSVRSFIAAE